MYHCRREVGERRPSRDFTRLTPSAPSMAIAEYWNVLANPKNITHSMPLVAALSGSAICANETA